MPRVRQNSDFKTASARFKKLPANRYHQTTVDEGVYLLYRRGRKRSMWYVRAQGHEQRPLGLTDDHQKADGRDVLTFYQAARLAIERATEAKATERPTAPRGGHTIGEAATEYLLEIEAQGKKSILEIKRVLDKDVLPDWKDVPFADVTETRINRWIATQINAPRRTRGGKPMEIDDSPEGLRRRRATAQKKWTVLRRTLNVGRERGWSDGRAWAGIKNLGNVDPPEDEFPTLAECKRLVRRAPKHFRPIIEATFLTGAAYGELIAMAVRDYTPATGHVRVFNSKRRPRHIPLTADGVALFDELTAGKDADDLIFQREGRAWRKSEQARPIAEANAKAKLNPPITLTRLRKAYGSILLNAGVPLEVVSKAMGHSDPSVTRRHYSRLLQSTIDEQIRGALPSFGRRRRVARVS